MTSPKAGTSAEAAVTGKTSWKVFWDLQCPYSRKNWERLVSIKKQFDTEYDFSIHLTSLAFHPQAFTAQCGASLVESCKGRAALLKFVDACFENQEMYTNAALGDARKSEIRAVFADIAEKAGVLDEEFTKEKFLDEIDNWEKAVKPAYAEHKVALGYGVYGTPMQVIAESLVPDTESAWGPEEWAEKLHTINSRAP
jgi:hypothetical protein